LDGGEGNDWAEYNQATIGIVVNLADGRATNDGQGMTLQRLMLLLKSTPC
jgi:hypothetical protein